MTNSADRCRRRVEQDALGEMEISAHALSGIHTARAMENFPLGALTVHPMLYRAMGIVKLAAAISNRSLGIWQSDEKAMAIIDAAKSLADGNLDQWNRTSALQGGAGTSLNMNVNEVIANQALLNLGRKPGDYAAVSPLDDINRHQSTNDTVPTAARIATLFALEKLEDAVVQLQESLQDAEQRFARIVKVGRTQYQDAVLTTLGRSFGAFSDLINRDRWRLSKCRERLRTVNIGGTAIGSGLAAKRNYIFSVIDTLKEITGLPLNRAENLVDATQNLDAFAEVSGIIRTLATSLIKICGDLRLMSSGPAAGLAEIRIPAVQAGSSVMPGKVNPVIPEAVQQAAMQYLGRDSIIAGGVSAGSLELNSFLPLIAENLLRGIDELRAAVIMLAKKCVQGITANEENCRRQAENSTATITALVEIIGYERAQQLHEYARSRGKTLRQAAAESGVLTEEEFASAVSPENVLKLGGEKDHG